MSRPTRIENGAVIDFRFSLVPHQSFTVTKSIKRN
uniref:Uncharacterized protein n=1 Tax=Arundo donax TaxID=35708 RepID=A0A0A8Y748_ARUDO